MNRPSDKPPKSRVLNVLYFVDSNKTKSFKMSLGAIYTLVALLFVLVAWSGVSTFLLVKQNQVATYRQERIVSLLSTIFSYQQRYDGIYERSYPKGAVASATSLDRMTKETEAFGSSSVSKTAITPIPHPSQGATASATEPKTKDAVASGKSPQPLKSTAEAAGTTGQTASAGQAADPARSTKAAKPERFEVKLEGIKGIATAQQSISLEFSIRNSMKPKRAVGYVFARATFSRNGKELIKTAPVGPDLSQLDRPIRAKGYKFSIRSFTRKTITMTYPQGEPAKLTKVELMMWSEKKHQKTYPVAMAKIKLVTPKRQPHVVATPSKNPLPAGQVRASSTGFPATEPLAEEAASPDTVKASRVDASAVPTVSASTSSSEGTALDKKEAAQQSKEAAEEAAKELAKDYVPKSSNDGSF